MLLLVCTRRKNYEWCFDVPTKAAIVTSIKKRAEMGGWGKLVRPDISDGLEMVCTRPVQLSL
jgi:hypothetical protein